MELSGFKWIAVNNLIVRFNYIFFPCKESSFQCFDSFSLGVFLSHPVIVMGVFVWAQELKKKPALLLKAKGPLNMNLSLSIGLSVLKEVLKYC